MMFNRVMSTQTLDASVDQFPIHSAVKPKVPSVSKSLAPVRMWLWCIAVLILIMITIGGATRLTDSGLSITTWDPIMGVVPPMSSTDWEKLFTLYKTTTEFQIQNSAMTMQEFKWIFWWEWGHRVFGRLIGVAFALPFLFFLVTKRLPKKLALGLLVIFALGAAQAALGWYMVKSGLVGRTDVSQYRLAAHLSLASLLLAATIWVALGINRARVLNWHGHTVMAAILLLLVFLQIAAGGFVAGMDAGHTAYDWPKMNGQWVPDGLAAIEPLWRNFTENHTAVQFNHRTLAYVIFALALIHAWTSFRVSSMLLAYFVLVQICLGVLALWFQVGLPIALTHQATAMIVLIFAVYNLHAKTVTQAPALDQR
jgi:heme a synthase